MSHIVSKTALRGYVNRNSFLSFAAHNAILVPIIKYFGHESAQCNIEQLQFTISTLSSYIFYKIKSEKAVSLIIYSVR